MRTRKPPSQPAPAGRDIAWRASLCEDARPLLTGGRVPTSQHWQIPHVLDVIAEEQPSTVLDVGSGYGKFGCLAREDASPTRVDAVDVNPPRFALYDHVYLGDPRRNDRVVPA